MMDLITTAALIMLGGDSGEYKLQSKTIIENGTYSPDDGYDGFGSVKVNVDDRYDEGYSVGYDVGYTESETAGEDAGYTEGETAKYNECYNSGYADGAASGEYTSDSFDNALAVVNAAGEAGAKSGKTIHITLSLGNGYYIVIKNGVYATEGRAGCGAYLISSTGTETSIYGVNYSTSSPWFCTGIAVTASETTVYFTHGENSYSMNGSINVYQYLSQSVTYTVMITISDNE